MKSTMDLADLIGFHIIMTKIPGRGDMKILIAGLGWYFHLLLCLKVSMIYTD